MNVENLNKLIAHLEALPPERVNMGIDGLEPRQCGSVGCILGHAQLLWPDLGTMALCSESGLLNTGLYSPENWRNDAHGVKRYPAHRVIATLKRLRDTYLSTGQVVVDWGPEPGEKPKTPWVAPHVSEVIAPTLPAEITSLLRPSLAKTEA